jgi:hypothetical protein
MLSVAIAYHGYSTDPLKFFPLEILLSLLIIFIAVYFFRVISISNEEIRIHGLFSSKDSAFITEGKTLVISLMPRRNLKFELYGEIGDTPIFDWMKSVDCENRDICVFRGHAVGGKGSVKRILKYFNVPASDADAILSGEQISAEYGAIDVFTATKNEFFEISIKFNETLV